MKYQIEAHNSGGDLIVILQDAYNKRYIQAANEPSRLIFRYPVDGIYASEVSKINLFWLRDEDGNHLDTFDIRIKRSCRSEGFAYYEVECVNLMAQLAGETVTYYFASYLDAKTISQIVTALLAFQEHVSPITVGDIDAAIGNAVREIEIENSSPLQALNKLRESIGGYIRVNPDRTLDWKVLIGEDKGQQIRYNKNMRGIDRTEDYTDLVTRLFYYGQGEGDARVTLLDAGHPTEYLDSDTQGTYGIISKVITDKQVTFIEDSDLLLELAQQYLEAHKYPTYSYHIVYADLSELPDGLDFDKLQLGSVVTAIDEDLGIDVEVYIVKIDKNLDHPEDTEIELSTKVLTVATEFMGVYEKQQILQNTNAITISPEKIFVQREVIFTDWMTLGRTAIKGDYIRTGKIESDNWGVGAGTQIDLTGETIKIGGSAAPKFYWDGVDLYITGDITIQNPGDIQIGDLSGDLDDIDNGATYGKVSLTDISAGHIIVRTVTDNLVLNPSFEQEGAWAVVEGAGTAAYSSVDKTEGTHSLLLPAPTTGWGCRAIPLVPGDKYTVRVKVKGTGATGSGLYIRMNEKTTYPSGDYVTQALRTSLTDFVANGAVPSTWTTYEYTYTVPAGIYWGSFSIYNWTGGPVGGIYIDEAEVRKKFTHGEWYDESGVEIDATHGINIYGADAALTTRATKAGTIQCKVDSSGRIVAGAGAVQLDAEGIHRDTTAIIDCGAIIDQDIADGAYKMVTVNLDKACLYGIKARFENTTDAADGFLSRVIMYNSQLDVPAESQFANAGHLRYQSIVGYSGPTAGSDTPYFYIRIENNTGGTKHFHGYATYTKIL